MADSAHLSVPGYWLAYTSYRCTRKGIFLFAEIVLCLVISICFSALTSAYSSLPVIEMIFDAVLFVFYICEVHSKVPFINCTSIIVLMDGRGNFKTVAGVLGLTATFLFGYDAYFTFSLWQQRHTAAPTDPKNG
uniref:MARVEL domain-containing protein n=1 Tax=Nannospalax galili TaxID=1026970 RepID=A0A8C6R7P6_NANGA